MVGAKVALSLCLAVSVAAAVSASTDLPLHVGIRADSAPTVGAEGFVTASVVVTRDLPGLSLEVQLPADGKIVGDSTVVVSSAPQSKPVELQTRIVFSTPGLKFVRAVAKCAEKPGVVWSDVAYVLLDIGATSSAVVTDTGAIRTAPRLLSKADGVRQGRPTYKRETPYPTPLSETNLDGGPEGFVATAPSQVGAGELVVSGKWSFTDRAGAVVGQRNAKLELRKAGVLVDTVLATTYTDWNGNFVFPAVADPEAFVYVRCYTLSQGTGNLAAVRADTQSDWYSADTDLVKFLQTGTQSIGEWCVDSSNPNYKAWWIVDDMAKAYNVPPDPVGGHVVDWTPTSTAWAHFTRGGDITLGGGDADDTPDTVLHEMGHSVMYNIYTDMPESNCPDPHYLMQHSHVNCAWTEGWAHVWHMWTTNDPIHGYSGGGGFDLESPTWGDGNDEGSDVEGRVAAAVWDITDSAIDGYDRFSGSWLDVWHIMYHHDCETFYQFYQQWKSHNYGTHGAVASIYQNTMNWNTSPVFGGLPDVIAHEDELRLNVMDLDDYASDPESQDYQLTFAIESVSTPDLQIGINSNHQVNLQGVQDWCGTATVVISCTDGIVTLTDTIVVTVLCVQDPPSISGIPDQTVDEDSLSIWAVNLYQYTTDPDNPDNQISFSITGNTNASCGASVDGYHINIAPAANWFGTSDVTVRATDPQGLWDEDTFRVTVSPVNDPPLIAGLPDRTLNEDTSLVSTIDLWSYASDVEIPASSLTYTVQSSELPAGTITIDDNRYVSITPPANYNGSGSVTIRAWDFDNGWGDDTFVVTVNPVSDPPVLSGVPDLMYETSKTVTTHNVDLWRYASDPDGPDSDIAFSITESTNTHIQAAIQSNRYLLITHGSNVSGYSSVTVRATDSLGRMYDEQQIDVVIGRKCDPCSEAFGLADNSWVIFPNKTVTVSHHYGFYIEDDNRISGIRIISTSNPDESRIAAVGGLLTSYEGERAVDCRACNLGGIDTTPPQPLAMTNRNMGGVWPGGCTSAVPEGRFGGLYNVGLLVRTSGTVTRTIPPNVFWIDDGSHVPYSTGIQALYVDCQPLAMYAPPVGSRVTVTGISGARIMNDKVVNTLRLRDRWAVKGMGGRVAYVVDTAVGVAAVYDAMLTSYGWNTVSVPLSQIESIDLSPYDIILIGADTGTWADTRKVNSIVASGKPVVAMGAGGARFLDQAPDLHIGWLNSASGTLKEGYVQNSGQVLYWWDNPINVPTNKVLDMMVAAATTTQLANPPAGVNGLLRHPTNDAYWPVAQEGRFMQWGYDTMPSNMNQVAKDLLVNCLYYMQGK